MICNAENKIKGGKLIRIKCEIKEDILFDRLEQNGQSPSYNT